MSQREKFWALFGSFVTAFFAVLPYVLPAGNGATFAGPFAVWTFGCVVVIAAGIAYMRQWGRKGGNGDVR